jgi:imidazolonepropionase-like amidohydrolase
MKEYLKVIDVREKTDRMPLAVITLVMLLTSLISSNVFAETYDAAAQDTSGPILFTNVNVFDGVNEALIKNANVVVTGNKITAVSTEPLAVAGGTVIDGGGRTLMPGMIDVHWHTYYANLPVSALQTADMSEVAILGLLGARDTLLRGFTTVRDIGGNPFAVKKFTDDGRYPGPRMLISGTPIGQTGGHFDLFAYSDVPKNPSEPLSYWERNGLLGIADGVTEVTKLARTALRQGATQLKIAGGGGVTSIYDPLDVQEYTFEEMKAIVDVAKTWNTYVAAHIFTDEAIQTAIRAGVKSIEHGNLILQEETLQMMKDNGVWLSAQPLIDDEDRLVFDNPTSTAKWIAVTDGTGRNYEAAKAAGVKIAFGTDMLFDPAAAANQGKMVTKLKNWFTPFEALKMVTSDNAELLMMSGPRHPYQEGPLGVIKEGAYADMILVDGNPLEDLDLVGDAEKNFVVIMKDGKIYKNTLH